MKITQFRQGKPCKHCGGTLRYITRRDCVACQKKKASDWRAADPVRHKRRVAEWQRANLEYKRTKERQWRHENREYFRMRMRQWREANPEHVELYNRTYSTDAARAARRTRTQSSRG